MVKMTVKEMKRESCCCRNMPSLTDVDDPLSENNGGHRSREAGVDDRWRAVELAF